MAAEPVLYIMVHRTTMFHLICRFLSLCTSALPPRPSCMRNQPGKVDPFPSPTQSLVPYPHTYEQTLRQSTGDQHDSGTPTPPAPALRLKNILFSYCRVPTPPPRSITTSPTQKACPVNPLNLSVPHPSITIKSLTHSFGASDRCASSKLHFRYDGYGYKPSPHPPTIPFGSLRSTGTL
eukprot:748704-Hanusia_phi.AAC.4